MSPPLVIHRFGSMAEIHAAMHTPAAMRFMTANPALYFKPDENGHAQHGSSRLRELATLGDHNGAAMHTPAAMRFMTANPALYFKPDENGHAQHGSSRLRELATLGDHNGAAMIERTLSKVGDVQAPAAMGRRVAPAVAGGVPVVGDYLAGEPECFRAPVAALDESAPVAVAVYISAAHKVDAETMTRRGAAVAALVLALMQVRPVTLVTLYGAHWAQEEDAPRHVAVIETDARQIDIPALAYAITHPSAMRSLCMQFSMMAAYPDRRGIWSVQPLDADEAIAAATQALGRPPEVYCGRLNDAGDFRNPAQWVREQLARLIPGAGGE